MDDQNQGGPRAPKACRACSKAKVRCELEDNRACKRCRRLNRECSGQEPGAHRRPRPQASSEVSALEAKLDRMVALLAGSEHPAKYLTTPAQSSPAQSSNAYSIDSVMPGEIEGEVYLEIFRTKMSPLFPFIMLPANVTAEQLRRERPFLYLNICAAPCQNASRQREILQAMREAVAERVVLQGEHSLDLLQGLLVHLAWFSPISCPLRPNVSSVPKESGYFQGSSQLDVFLRLTVSQVISLNLNQGLASMRALDRPLAYIRAVDFHPDQIPPRTLEERRTYLGCYYLTVMLSACVRDLEPLRFSRYTEECCRVLSDAWEFPTDTYLVHLVRMAHLVDQIIHTVTINALDSPVVLSASLGMSIQSYQAQIQKLRVSFAADPPQSMVLLFHCDTLEIILYRLALSDELSGPPCEQAPVTRLDLLFRCLEATKSFFYHCCSISPDYLPFFPFSLWCQFGQAIVNMSRLLLYKDDDAGWDQSYVRSMIDFNETVNGLKQKMNEAGAWVNRNNKDEEFPEVLGRMNRRLDLIKEIHLKRDELQKEAQPQALEPPDFSFMFNMPFDAFFPYGDFGGLPSGFEAPATLEYPMQ